MFDSRFAYSQTNDGFRHRLPGSRLFVTLADAREDWDGKVAHKEALVGRVLTQAELEHGLSRKTPLTDRERRAIQKRHQAELNPPQPDLRTPNEKYLDDLRARQAEEREAKLSPLERRILVAERRVAEEKVEAIQLQARRDALGTDAGRRLASELDAAIEFAEFNADVPEADLLELKHQAALLAKTGDVRAAAANVRIVQQRMLGNVDAQAAELRAHADKVASKAASLRSEPDAPPKPAGDIRTLLS